MGIFLHSCYGLAAAPTSFLSYCIVIIGSRCKNPIKHSSRTLGQGEPLSREEAYSGILETLLVTVDLTDRGQRRGVFFTDKERWEEPVLE